MDLAERGGTERRDPWETERAGFVRSLIAHHLGDDQPRQILDVGAGDGWYASELSQVLTQGSEVGGWDVNYRSADLAADLPGGVVRTADEPERGVPTPGLSTWAVCRPRATAGSASRRSTGTVPG